MGQWPRMHVGFVFVVLWRFVRPFSLLHIFTCCQIIFGFLSYRICLFECFALFEHFVHKSILVSNLASILFLVRYAADVPAFLVHPASAFVTVPTLDFALICRFDSTVACAPTLDLALAFLWSCRDHTPSCRAARLQASNCCLYSLSFNFHHPFPAFFPYKGPKLRH